MISYFFKKLLLINIKMIKLKYMIYLSILACYVVTQTYYECNSSGQTNCACWKIAIGDFQTCDSSNNEVCHLNNGCVTPCPTNDVLKTGNECNKLLSEGTILLFF